MDNLKKVFTFGVVLATIVWAMGVATFVPVASAAVVEPGDVFKGTTLDAVYFQGADGNRYTYPQDKYYFTWQYDFSVVKTITDSELADIPLAGNVVTRYGTKLIKIQSIPTVYAVSREGDLYSIPDESVATDMFGADWTSRVTDVQDGFWPNYTDTGTDLDGSWYPDGFLLKTTDSPDVWFIWDGMKRWIASEEAFYANRFMWEYVTVTSQSVLDSYTEGDIISGAEAALIDDSQGGGAEAPVEGEGALTVSLSSDTPGSLTAPQGATGVEVGIFDFSAGSDAGVTLNSLEIKRVGIGNPNEIAKVYLYDGDSKLTSGKTVNTSTNLAFFTNLNWYVDPGQTDSLRLLVDVGTGLGTNGSHQFQITNADAVDSTAESVMGTFPVKTNTLSISTVSTGSVDLESSSNTYTRKVGEQGVEVGRFTVFVGTTEDAHFNGVTLYSGGRDIYNNMELYRGSDKVADCTESGDYHVCDLSTPWPIEKGDSASFTAKADIEGRKDDTGELYVRYNTDVRVEGDTLGFNLGVDGSEGVNTDSYVDEAATIAGGSLQKDTTTVEAGQITISFNGPTTQDVSENTNDVVLMDFTMTSQSNVDVEKAIIDISDSSGNLVAGDVDDLELVCGGMIVATKSTVNVDAAGVDDDGANGVDDPAEGLNTFTDTWSLTGGESTECQVRIDITNNPGGDEKIKAALNDPKTNWTFKASDTGDSISDIVPSGDVAGNEMSIVSASLTIDVAGTPAAETTYVTGSQDVEAVAWTFTAGDAADVQVNTVELTAYLDDDQNNFGDGGDKDDTSNAQDVMVKVTIYDTDDPDTPLANSKGLTVNTGDDISVQFDTLSWVIPAGVTKKLLAEVDIATTAPLSSDDDDFALAIEAAGDVDAEYGSGSSITPTLNNGNTTPDIYQTVTSAGDLDMVEAADTPNASLLVSGTSDNLASKIKFSSTKEAFVVQELQVKETAANGYDEVASVTLEYDNSLGVTETVTQTQDINGFSNFNGLDIYVPKDGNAVLNIYADLNKTATGADNDDSFNLTVDWDTNLRAVGQGSSTVLTQTATTADPTVNSHYVFESFPSIGFAYDTPSGELVPSGNTHVARVMVSANDGKDISFTNADGNTLTFQVGGLGGAGDPDEDFVVKEESTGNVLCSTTTFNIGTDTSYQCDFATNNFVVTAGTDKYMNVYMETNELINTGDSVQIWFDDGTSIDWDIDQVDVGYDHADIIFQGDVYGGSLKQ